MTPEEEVVAKKEQKEMESKGEIDTESPLASDVQQITAHAVSAYQMIKQQVSITVKSKDVVITITIGSPFRPFGVPFGGAVTDNE